MNRGALLPGMAQRVQKLLGGLRVRAASAPHHAVIRGACAMLEVADLSPHTFELRGKTLSFKQVRADCFENTVWLWTDYTSDRLIFSR